MFVLRAFQSRNVSRLINGSFTVGCGKWCDVVGRFLTPVAVSDGVKRLKEESGRLKRVFEVICKRTSVVICFE